jgi:hypothetical protein
MKKYFYIFFFTFIYSYLSAQQPQSDIPISFILHLNENINEILLPAPDVQKLLKEDKINEDKGKPMRNGYVFNNEINFKDSSKISYLCDGGNIYRLIIKSYNAKYLGFIFSNIQIPEGGKLFLYSRDKSFVISYIGENPNNDRNIVTQQIPYDEVILEYYEPANYTEQNNFNISQIIYYYK